MTTCRAELELAAVHLKRAEELAQFFQHQEDVIDLIKKLKRGAVHAQQQIHNSGPSQR